MHNERKDVIAEKKSIAAIAGILRMPDMAYAAVDDLRVLKRWEYCDAILKLPAKAGYEKNATLRKSVLRFALQCPLPAAKAFVQLERNRDAELVADTAELLDLEKEAGGPPKK